jgi:hypothetical protein
MNRTMIARRVTEKLVKAFLALALVLATAPIVHAPAASPCDCPSMQMHGQSMDHQVAPAKQKSVPCNEMPNCLCGALCGTAVALSPNSSAADSGPSENFSWPDLVGASGHSIKPAIPPPIANV